MSRRLFAVGILLLVASGLTMALPLAGAQTAPSTVIVKIPPGSGSASASENNLPGYTPNVITVVVGVNNTVMWENNDTVNGVGTAHTITDVTQPTGATFSGSGNLPVNMSYTFTFTVPGTYQYDCSYHAWMRGTVVVLAASTSTSTSTTSTHTTPEFPEAWLAAILFAVIALVVVAVPRTRPRLSTNAGPAV